MDFDKDHKVIIDTLNEEEANDFLVFLADEAVRHQEAIKNAQGYIDELHTAEGWPSLIKFYKSAIYRHQKDIEGIDIVTKKVKEMFKWD